MKKYIHFSVPLKKINTKGCLIGPGYKSGFKRTGAYIFFYNSYRLALYHKTCTLTDINISHKYIPHYYQHYTYIKNIYKFFGPFKKKYICIIFEALKGPYIYVLYLRR